jgi:hypothetical protein
MRIYLDINTALVGAYVLLKVSDLNPVTTNFLRGNEYFITRVKLTIAILLNSFASAFAGAYAGRAMLRVVTLKAARIAVTTMLVILSVALAFGIV